MKAKCVNCGAEYETQKEETLLGLCQQHNGEFRELIKKITEAWHSKGLVGNPEGNEVRVAYITNDKLRRFMARAVGPEVFYANLKKRIEPVMDLALQARRIWCLYAEPDFLEKEIQESKDVDQPQEGSKQAPA